MMTRTAVVFVCWCALAAPAAAQEAIFLVRHAERADQSTDSRLSPQGEARAVKLARWLNTAGITHVFTTDLRRTAETAAPFASGRQIAVQQIPAADTDSLVRRVRGLGPGDRALVVGHSNTVPMLLARFGVSETVTLADDDYDNIFVVIPRDHQPAVLLRFKY
jgi:broad specificity phosphatase PhoE